MWIFEVEIVLSVIFLSSSISLGIECPQRWFDCGNSKCISEIWLCDGDNDCGNMADEHNCGESFFKTCLSNQFQCSSDKHCIPDSWHCDGENDCEDKSDEAYCDNVHNGCKGFWCNDHRCIPLQWQCDGHHDCLDGSDEKSCSLVKTCGDLEYLCSSGTCINRSLVCDGKPDCNDGSDEGLHCNDSCKNVGCSQKCESTPSGPRCFCNDGYALQIKDEKTCLDIDECLEDGFCSHKCINTIGSYKCFCLDGYELINRTCKAQGPEPLLIMSSSKDIRGIRLRSNQYFLIRKAIDKASAVDVDPNNQMIYWVEISNRSSIYSAKLDGSSVKTVLSHGLQVPEDIAVDYVANNLYITDSGLRQVLVCNIAGTMCHVLHNKKIEKPRSIILDQDEGLLYWCDWGEYAGGIYRSGMDGSRYIPVVSDKIAWPNSITIDHPTNRLYWADAKLNTIEYITLDGKLRKVLLNSAVFHPYALAVFEDTIYWTDSTTFSLESCNKFSGHGMTLIARENGERIMGVHVYHPVLTTKGMNPCWSNDCSHMCLISPLKTFTCTCPHGFELADDGKSCTIKKNSGSIFVSEASSVYYIRPEAVGSETVTELSLSLNTAIITRVSYDPKSRILFIADANPPAIHAINMTSLIIQELVKKQIAFPEDLSFDGISDNLYWIDSSKKTAEVVSVNSLKRVTLLKDLSQPVALAISPIQGCMFIATYDLQATVTMYDMAGKNKKIIHSIQGLPMSIALHPSKKVLYWADPNLETISYINYEDASSAKILKDGLHGILSVAVSEEYVYWTDRKRELSLLKGNKTYILQLPGQEKGSVSRKATYVVGTLTSEKSPCQINNGGCSYLCVTSLNGRSCVCPDDLSLSIDNITCIARRCQVSDFRCMSNGRCLPASLRCDGNTDCDDGSDEVRCSNRCSGDDFQCKNGRCILKSWRCDNRNDCVDNSDEEDCPQTTACVRDQVACTDGECISTLWRCDGESDCADSSDEMNCNETRCDIESQIRCDSGQCIPISWVCDGSSDCYDSSDEKNCTKNVKTCLQHEFRCIEDGSCIEDLLRCDGREDCSDGSDEKNCSHSESRCKTGMFLCNEGTCIYEYEVCDGHKDCDNNEDESNCTKSTCNFSEFLCPSTKKCILRTWLCDGEFDCLDGSDEKDCPKSKHFQSPSFSTKDCDEFFCISSKQCLPWSKVCDGKQDCENLPDEGGLCSRSCMGDNGGCSQICNKSPRGSHCSCLKGYKLLSDNKTCDDIDECLEPGTCTHFCNNTKGGFKCSCGEGYYLHHDHRLCRAEGGPATLVYLLGDQIRGFDLDSHSQKVFLSISSADMRGMDYDASERVFYWTEWNDGSINSYSPDTHRQDMLVQLDEKPIYVRYDWIEKNLFYVDSASNIGVCTKNGRFCRNLLHSPSHIGSIDISPTTRHIFWTIFASLRDQNSGVIERAEMDGSNRVEIISNKTIEPASITVDHVLKHIFWIDMELNTLECADFNGFNRRQVVKYSMYYAFSMAVFENHVYWADWSTDSIIRCEKFTGDCSTIHVKNAKALILLVVHRVMQPEGKNRCHSRNCSQLCLPTVTSYVCMCGDEYTERNGLCEDKTKPSLRTPVKECSKHYCLDDAECVVEDGKFVCKCPPQYTGNKCQIIVQVSNKTYDYSWIVFVLFAICIVGIIVLLFLLCPREKLEEVKQIQYKKFGFHHFPIKEMEDENSYDELIPDELVPTYEKSHRKFYYTVGRNVNYTSD